MLHFRVWQPRARQPGSGAAESKQSRFCPRLPAAHPFIPASPHPLIPSRPRQLWNQPRWAKPKLSHQERTIKQTETEWSDTCQSCMEEAFTTYLCYCENRIKTHECFLEVCLSFLFTCWTHFPFSVELENFTATEYVGHRTASSISWLLLLHLSFTSFNGCNSLKEPLFPDSLHCIPPTLNTTKAPLNCSCYLKLAVISAVNKWAMR